MISLTVPKRVSRETKMRATRVQRQEGQLAGNDERGGDSFVQRRKHGIVRPRQLRQMAVGSLPPRLDPRRKTRDVVIVRDEAEGDPSLRLESRQESFRLSDGQSVLRSLRENAHEA